MAFFPADLDLLKIKIISLINLSLLKKQATYFIYLYVFLNVKAGKLGKSVRNSLCKFVYFDDSFRFFLTNYLENLVFKGTFLCL